MQCPATAESLATPSSQQLANGWDQLGWHDHYSLSFGLISRFILGNGFVFALVFVMLQDLADAFLIPAGRELLPAGFAFLRSLPIVFHRRLPRCRRRYVFKGLPAKSKAVLTKTLSRPGSRV